MDGLKCLCFYVFSEFFAVSFYCSYNKKAKKKMLTKTYTYESIIPIGSEEKGFIFLKPAFI